MKHLFFIFFLCLQVVQKIGAEGQKTFVLLTMLYNENNETRFNEYTTCLSINKNHPLIQKIHVLYDTTRDIPHNKSNMMHYIEEEGFEVTIIQRRPSYKEIIELANIYYPDSYIIVANADIFFNYTLQKLITYTKWETVFFALTRWNVQDDYTSLLLEGWGPYAPNMISADCWIFKTPFLPPVNSESIYMGSEGCDHKLASVMKKGGFIVKNPCLSIQACHLHLSQIRHYQEEQAVSKNSVDGIAVSWECLEGFEQDIKNYKEQAHLLKPYMNTSIKTQIYAPAYILMTMLYNEKDPKRINEYKTVLEINKSNKRIHTYHIFYDVSQDSENESENELLLYLKQNGYVITYIKDRISFGKIFSIANELYPNSYILCANADIFFDRSIEKLDSTQQWDKKCLALTRWNFQLQDQNYFIEGSPGGLPNYASQDAWILKTPIDISDVMYEIKMGVLGCDSGIAYAFAAQDYDISNPCASIRAFHLHTSQARTHEQKNAYKGPMKILPWTFLSTHTEDEIVLYYEMERVKLYDLFKVSKNKDAVSLILIIKEERNIYKRIEQQLSILKNKANPYIKNITILYEVTSKNKSEADLILDFYKREQLEVFLIEKNSLSKEELFSFISKHFMEQKVLIASGDIIFADKIPQNQTIIKGHQDAYGVLFDQKQMNNISISLIERMLLK